MRDDTRVRVTKAIAELGYRPNPSARSPAARRSYLVGLVYDNLSPSYLINVQNGSLNMCRAEGYDLVIYPCDYRSDSLSEDLAAMVRQSRLDGIVLTPPLCDMSIVTDSLVKLGVLFTRVAPADDKYVAQSVVTNDGEVTAKMTQHLIDLGHRDIAFIRGHPDHLAVCNRYEGYVAPCKAPTLSCAASGSYRATTRLTRARTCAPPVACCTGAHRDFCGERRYGRRRTARCACAGRAGAHRAVRRRLRRYANRAPGLAGVDDDPSAHSTDGRARDRTVAARAAREPAGDISPD